MAVSTITITGKVLTPDGTAAPGGHITLTLSAPGSADDAGTSQRIGGEFTTEISSSDGSVNFAIVANDDITPSETTYQAKFKVDGLAAWYEEWSVDSSGGSSQDIGDITRVSSTSVSQIKVLDTTDISTVSAGSGREFWLARENPTSSSTESRFFVCLGDSGSTQGYDWVLLATGKRSS